MRSQKLQIGEVATLLNITPKAIRHYHSIGLLPEPPRADNGYRLYGVPEIERLQLIGRLRQLGLSLKQIAFILDADDPDALLSTLLQHRLDDLEHTIRTLRHQQAEIVAFQQAEIRLAEWPHGHISTASIVRDAIAPVSTNLADVMLAVEEDMLAHLDRYIWPEGYDVFWDHVSRHMAMVVQGQEHQLIRWLHRFLSLASMDADDMLARAWMQQLHASPIRPMMSQLFSLPDVDELPVALQQQILQVVLMSMEASCSPLQREFMQLVLSRP